MVILFNDQRKKCDVGLVWCNIKIVRKKVMKTLHQSMACTNENWESCNELNMDMYMKIMRKIGENVPTGRCKDLTYS